MPVILHSDLAPDIDIWTPRWRFTNHLAARRYRAQASPGGKPEALSVSTVIEKAQQAIPTISTLKVLSRDRNFCLDIDVSVIPRKYFKMPKRPRLVDADHFTHLDNISIDVIQYLPMRSCFSLEGTKLRSAGCTTRSYGHYSALHGWILTKILITTHW